MDAEKHLPQQVADLLVECRKAMKDKNYNAAIKSVNAALKYSEKSTTAPHLLIGLLDYRHAIYHRLGDPDSALKDAKSMIRLDRKDARGYLRCGAVERFKGNKTAALRYLEHGLKSCSEPEGLDILHREAKRTRDQLSAELVLSRARDPMTTLPLEIMEIVLSYLHYKQHVQMLRVSKSWKRVLSVLPPLTDTLAFPDFKQPVTLKMLLVTLRRLKTPKRLILAGLTGDARATLLDRLMRTRMLESLHVFQISDPIIDLAKFSLFSANLRTISIEYPTRCSHQLVYRILGQCSGLEIARFMIDGTSYVVESWSFTSHSLLELDLVCKDNKAPLYEMALDMPRLRSFSLRGGSNVALNISEDLDLRHLQNLTRFSLYDCDISDLFLPPSITDLRMERCHSMIHSAGLVERPHPEFPALDNLKSLSILHIKPPRSAQPTYPPFICDAAAKTKPGKLTSLAVSQVPDKPNDLTALMESGWFAGLTELLIEGPFFGDQQAALIVAQCPQLERVQVHGAAITGVFVAELIKAPNSKMRAMILQDCAKVSKDTVPWAAERGVHVECISSWAARGSGSGSGRKVRELE
ncbi:hypothetical protein PV04_10949 [Phialophora macrospora]|uniref:F-box domain-containing protein n=1 Tax=Phialophora macrospora TaxID=1851006 RepID=A0A0D2FRZ0_9EURO|nr:hypothetical protein PV04_10949 [Phialophora macrospora]